MSDAIELLIDIEKYYGSLNDVPECVVKYFDYLSSMICNETKVSRLAVLTELEREIEARIEDHKEEKRNNYTGRYFQESYAEGYMQAEAESILSLIRSKKGGA